MVSATPIHSQPEMASPPWAPRRIFSGKKWGVWPYIPPKCPHRPAWLFCPLFRLLPPLQTSQPAPGTTEIPKIMIGVLPSFCAHRLKEARHSGHRATESATPSPHASMRGWTGGAEPCRLAPGRLRPTPSEPTQLPGCTAGDREPMSGCRAPPRRRALAEGAGWSPCCLRYSRSCARWELYLSTPLTSCCAVARPRAVRAREQGPKCPVPVPWPAAAVRLLDCGRRRRTTCSGGSQLRLAVSTTRVLQQE